MNLTLTYTINGVTNTQTFTGSDNCKQCAIYIHSNLDYENISAITLSGNGYGESYGEIGGNYYGLFEGCSSLTSIDVSNFNTSNVTDMWGMFYNCESLLLLDVSNFNTSNVTNMSQMFYNCYYLGVLDLSNFDTSNVTDMQEMFANCRYLSSVDVSNFDTSNVINMQEMFAYCSSLTCIYCNNNWNNSTIEDSDYMFWDCTSLVGAISYDEDKIDVNYANPTTGYFTNPSTKLILIYDYEGDMCAQSFAGNNNCEQCAEYIHEYLTDSTTMILSGNGYGSATYYNESWGTNVGMFFLLRNLTTLDLSNFNTTNVTDMNSMFCFCSSLTTLDVSNFNTSNVIDMTSMFQDCSSLTIIYCNDDWNTATVEDSDDMFYNCQSLVGAISYDSTKTDINYANPTTGYFTRLQTAYDVYFNGTQLEHIYFNGTEIDHLYFNGTQII